MPPQQPTFAWSNSGIGFILGLPSRHAVASLYFTILKWR
jgi:hypothetical protein